MGALHFEADVDIIKLDQKMSRIETSIQRMAQQAANSGSILDKSFQKAGQSASFLGNDVSSLQRNLLGLASAATLGRLGQEVINIRGEFQQLGIAFEVMLGSKEKADKLMAQQIAFAQKTPYTLTDVATNTKQLLAMGISQEKVMQTMKDLGNVAAGVSVPIARVAVNYGQVATMGKLMGRELRDFNMAGIPLQEELAKNLGKAKDEIAGMVEAGQIGFPMVEKAFQTMSGEGGKFYNLMERQNASVTGQVSNLTDKIQVMMNSIGKSNEGLIYGGITGLTDLVANYEDVLKVLESLIVTYGIYRVALMMTTASQNISMISTMAQEWLVMGRALGFATANQMLLNSAMLANPVVAAIAGITALVAVMLIFSDKAKTAEDHIKDLNDSMEQIGKQIEIETTIQKFYELDKKVVKTKEEQAEYNKTIQNLATIFPDAITETDKYGKAVGLVSEKIIAQNKELRDNLILVTQKKGQEAQKELNKLLDQQKNLQNDINTGQKVTTVNNPRAGGAYQITTVFTSEEIAKKRDELATLAQSISQFGSSVDQENQKVLQLKTIEANQILSGYKNLFSEVSTFSKQQAIDAKSALQKIATPEGSIASDLVKSQITALDQYIAKFKITGQQEKEWQTELIAAQAKLNEIKKAGYESTDIAKEKSDQEAIIKTLEDKLDIKHKEKKAVDELKQAQEDLEKAVKKGDRAAIDSQAAKVTLLQKEYDLRKYIADEALAFSRGEVTQTERNALKSPTPITPMSLKPIVSVGQTKMLNGVMYELTEIDKKGVAIWMKRKAEISSLTEFSKSKWKQGTKEQEEYDKDVFEQKKQFQEDLLNYSRQFTGELIDQLGLTQQQSKALNGVADTVFNIAKGDYLAAGFSMASTIIGALFSGKVEKEDPMIYALKNINDLLERQSSILSSLSGNNYFELAKKQYDDYGNSIYLNNKKLRDSFVFTKEETDRIMSEMLNFNENNPNYQTNWTEWKKQFGSISDNWNPQDFVDAYTNGTIALDKEQTEWVKTIIESQKQRAELLQQIFKEALGFNSSDVTDSIFSGIEDGLKLGENSLGGFAQSFGDLMKKALMQSVTDAMNLDITNTFLPEYQKVIEDAIITPEERANLESIYANLIRKAEEDSANIESITGKYTANTSSAATGITASLTEETGSLLAGLITGTRIDIKSIQETSINMLELMDQSLSVLGTIANNTKHNSVLPEIRDELKNMNQNIKNLG